MNRFKCEKAPNCFAESETYQYRLPMAVDEERLAFWEPWGVVKVRKNLRRPFYQITTSDQVIVKGILNDKVMKISFPTEGWDVKKERIELLINLFIERFE